MALQIQFSTAIATGIKSHLQLAYPHEGCGFLFGNEAGLRSVTRFLPTENVHAGDHRRRFSIAPEAYLRAEQYALDHGLELLGIYHSHPDHPAVPSGTDLEHAVPWFSYLIVTTTAQGPTDFRSWQLDAEGTFQEEQLLGAVVAATL